MAYDEEQEKRSRVVVETPGAKREYVQSESVRTPDRNGVSAGMVGVLVVVAIALITMLVLFWMSNQQTTDPNANTVAQQQQPPAPIIQQAPAQQPPVIIQQPAPATQPAPIIISPPAGGSTETTAANVDATIQLAIDKQMTDDPTLSSLGVTATVMNAKVTLIGTVKSETLKNQVEKMVRKVKGVKEVDNQISVVAD